VTAIFLMITNGPPGAATIRAHPATDLGTIAYTIPTDANGKGVVQQMDAGSYAFEVQGSIGYD